MSKPPAQPQPKATSAPKVKLPYLTVPQGDLFNSIDKGFISFWKLQRTLKQQDFRGGSSSRRSKTQYDQLANTLQDNKRKLGQLNNSIVTLRQHQYDEYIKNSHRYNKLLQLNTRRSRLATLAQMSNIKKVGEVKVKQAEEIKAEDVVYSAGVSRILVRGWKPESREGQVCIVYKDYLVLLGGHNSTPLSNVCFFNLRENAWVKVNRSELNRSYHSGLLYRGHYVIMFGGLTGPIGYAKDRQCLATSCIYDITSGFYKVIKVSNEEIVEPRRNHGASIFGKFMVVFGGINNKNHYLRDFKYLDLKELKWYNKEYKADEQTQKFLEQGLARHSLQSNFQSRQSYQMYSSNYEQTQGLFLFGGTNQAGQHNILLQIRLNKYTPVISKLDPAGIHPSSIQPLVTRYSDNVFLMISGERAEREINLYKIAQNEFVTVDNRIHLPSVGGISSSLVAYRDSYYVVFGVGEQGYLANVTNLTITERKKETASRQKAKILLDTLIRRYSISESSEAPTIFHKQ